MFGAAPCARSNLTGESKKREDRFSCRSASPGRNPILHSPRWFAWPFRVTLLLIRTAITRCTWIAVFSNAGESLPRIEFEGMLCSKTLHHCLIDRRRFARIARPRKFVVISDLHFRLMQ
ncbi:MAG: hypothetical protein BGN91_12540 [Nitrobacter sp. 62-13]|jgi:hypothetical protein|nr:MAG: hypothetical protein BGN91_12540 [Nitrobacter sp. 62-13]